LQRLAQDGARGEAYRDGSKAGRAPARPAAEVGVQIQIWEDDPLLEAVVGGDPVPAEPIPVDVPENNQPSLQTHIVDQEPEPGIFDPSTPEFRYWNAASALARGINFWGPLLPNGTRWTTDQQPLHVQLDEGVDFNAFFARDSGLNFFHGEVDKVTPPVTVYS